MSTVDARYAEVIESYFSTPEKVRRARSAIDRYFYREAFTGSQFELIADSDNPNEITARDIVAVSTLGVNVPAGVAIWLLSDTGRESTSKLLRGVPADVDLWDALDLLGPTDPLWRLWDSLSRGCWPEVNPANGMGDTITSKLLAAKRPRIVPIQDSVVLKLFPRTDNWWRSFGFALAGSGLREGIAAATDNAPEHVSLLRRLDVVLWMCNVRS